MISTKHNMIFWGLIILLVQCLLSLGDPTGDEITSNIVEIMLRLQIIEEMVALIENLQQYEVIVWQVQDYFPVPIDINEFTLESNHPHIVFESITNEQWNLFYWIPKRGHPEFYSIIESNHVATAIFTMTLAEMLSGHKFPYHYSREIKGNESKLFKAYFTGSDPNKYRKKPLEKNFVLFEEKDYVGIVQGSVEKLLRADNCAVLYYENVYMFCGNEGNVSNKMREMASTLGKTLHNQVQKYYEEGSKFIEVDYKKHEYSEEEEYDIKQFFINAGFQINMSNPFVDLKPKTEEQITTLRMKWKRQRIYRLSKYGEKGWFNEFLEGPLYKFMLRSTDCYTVFFEEVNTSGIFLWIGKQVNDVERVEAAAKVENAVRDYHLYNWCDMPLGSIPVVLEGNETPEFIAIFLDWFNKDNGESGE